MARTLTLSAAGVTLDLARYDHGLIVSQVDLGAPAVREVTADLPNQDGADDQTAFLGQRVVTFTGTAVAGTAGSRSAALKLLAPFLDPKARPTLTFALDDDVEPRTLRLRAAQWSAVPAGDEAASFQAQWKGDPVAFAADESTGDVAASSTSMGRTYPRTYNLTYPSTSADSGLLTIVAAGDYDTWPTYRIYGPVTNPTVALVDESDQIVAAVSLTVGVDAADYLEVDTQARTVRLNGDPAQSRYSTVDFPNTTWEPLATGVNKLSFTATSASVGAHCVVAWRDAYLI